MRIYRYKNGSSEIRLVAESGGSLRDFTEPAMRVSPGVVPDVGELLGSHGLVGLRRLAEGGVAIPGDRVADGWIPMTPIARPKHIVAVAANYSEHVEETTSTEAGGQAGPAGTPWLFLKPYSSLVGDRGDIPVPRTLGRDIDWEVELGVVIGRTAKDVPATEAFSYVGGYTVVNDVTARRLQVSDEVSEDARDKFFAWQHGKWFDNFCAVGPCVSTPEEADFESGVDLALRVNGDVRQRSNTRFMTFSIPQIVEFITAIMTLHPGDIIATGTPAGVGKASGTFLSPGDEMIASVEGVGRLRNTLRGAI